ncbi:MAG: hypothetical protein WBS19_14385 [Candidatus Korobacteraceae bacterium]
MEIKSQDVLVLLKLVSLGGRPWTYTQLGAQVEISVSLLYSAIKRCEAARLIELGDRPKPYRPNLKEFLIHGVKYCFPVQLGGLTRGIPTSYAAPPMNSMIAESSDPPPVWPHAKGPVRGIALSPIHRAAPDAALKDPKLYELLALLDAIRTGRAREREIAVRELTVRIDQA